MKNLPIRTLAGILAPLAALGGLALVFAWVVTWGRAGLFDAPLDYQDLVSSSFYDAQARALLSGRSDVPCNTTRGESFVIGGRCYGYFGITPALLRIPLNAALPGLEGRWSRFLLLVSNLLAAAAASALAWRFLKAEDLPHGERLALLLCYGTAFSLGGSAVFMLGNPWTYHEAIAWGTALAMASYLALDVSLVRDSIWWLVAAILLGAGAANARVTVGLGPLIAAGVMLVPALVKRAGPTPAGNPGSHRSVRVAVPALLLVMAAASTPFLWNAVRFGTASPPLGRQVIYARNPARLEQAGKGLLQAGNLPCTLSAYWSPTSMGTRSSFPWVVPGWQVWQLPEPYPESMGACRGSTVNYTDPVTSVPLAMPAQLALALLGIGAAWRWRLFPWRRYAAPLLGAAAASVPIHLYHTISYRYVQDLFPLLAILGTSGICLLARLRCRSARLSVCGLLLLLSAWGLYMNVSASLTHNLPQPEAIRLLLELR